MKLASVGTHSGVVGAINESGLVGVQVWQRAINGQGGLHGHPVALTVYDDGFDPARHSAAVRQAAEQDGVIGFVMQQAAGTAESSLPYIDSKRIPIVGTDTAAQFFFKSKMFFPQATSGNATIYAAVASIASRMIPAKRLKLGTLICTEASSCTEGDNVAHKTALKLGLRPVYRGRASIAQPDYTAECLSARNAGAEILFMILDANAIDRVARSCARQGYKPRFATFLSLIQDRMKDNPNLAGMLGVSNVFPWFQTNSAATAAFHDAMARYAPGVRSEIGHATGWVAGKLLELAAQHLPEPPTSAALLAGLWAMKAEDLGGMTQPLTFRADAPAPDALACWFDLIIDTSAWTSPDRFTRHCANWRD